MQNIIKQVDKTTIKLNNITYKGYPVGELPNRFAFIYNSDKDQEGINSWFNHQGLTYIGYKPTIWSYV